MPDSSKNEESGIFWKKESIFVNGIRDRSALYSS